jgi:hypothetical protein
MRWYFDLVVILVSSVSMWFSSKSRSNEFIAGSLMNSQLKVSLITLQIMWPSRLTFVSALASLFRKSRTEFRLRLAGLLSKYPV